ncbi:hypothetical protein LZZ90_00695 [Flavobacterium sp. SM15]|uniref:hypothetical protein n=1 Tax=Flavobacterium sp. SM15 TaxID=2908005 RepID=UPI001EDC1E00|nr:hypothetical protein [Flavobacterium sp. SM15]MCG2610020.1 hypothetical protein [Flavobacterium sp. SM15]
MPITYVGDYNDEFLNGTVVGIQTYLKFINKDKIEFMYGGIEFALLRDKQHYAVVTFKYMFEHDRFPVEISVYEHNKKGNDTLLAFADKQCLSQIQYESKFKTKR